MPPYLANTFDPINRLPLTQQALQVLQMFRAVRSDEDYVMASRRWQEVRGRLLQEEEKLQCSKSGAGRDRDIGIGILDDLAKAPVSILLPCAQLVLAFSARDKDGLYESLNDAVEATKEKAFDEGVEKTGKKILDRGAVAYQPLRETLLRVLQQYSKRSRKHFSEILTGLEGIIKGVTLP